MKNKTGLKILMAVFSLMLIFSATALGQAKRSACSGTTDSAIAAKINNHIKKIKAGNRRSNIRIDVRVKNKQVHLTVRRASSKTYNEVAQFAKRIRCVRKVEVTNPGCQSAGCPTKFYMCGGTCIPCLETCSP